MQDYSLNQCLKNTPGNRIFVKMYPLLEALKASAKDSAKLQKFKFEQFFLLKKG